MMAAPERLRPPPATASGVDLRRLVAANDAAVAWFRTQITTADAPRRYLTRRGLGTLVNREWPWRVGYAPPGWTTLTDHLRAAGFTPDELVTAGLSTRTRTEPTRLIDFFRDRIIFPIRDPAGHVVGFIGRASPRSLAEDNQLPKYLNTHESPIYNKESLLFGIAEQQERITAGWRPVLVEGPADTIATWLSYSRHGSTGSVAAAPCGTALSPMQAAILREMPGTPDGLVVALDGDTAGHKAADAAFGLLHAPAPPGPLLAAEFVAGSDPADLLTRPNGRAQLRAALRYQTRPLIFAVVDHHLERIVRKFPAALQEIEGRLDAARALAPRVLAAANPEEATRLVQHIAKRTNVGVDIVMSCAAEHLERRVDHLVDELNKRLPASVGGWPPPTAAFPPLRPGSTWAATPLGKQRPQVAPLGGRSSARAGR